MRWLWRIIIVLVIVFLVKNNISSLQKVFINWQNNNHWQGQILWQIKSIQKGAQNLPDSIEEEFKKLFKQETVPTGNFGTV